MTLTLYWAPMSSAGITVAVLKALNVEPDKRVEVSIMEGDTHKPDFLKLNPHGKVPVIVHDGVVLFESAAITLYLGETFGVKAGLYPPPGPGRGEVMKWVVWANTDIYFTASALHIHIPLEAVGEKAKANDLPVCPDDYRKKSSYEYELAQEQMRNHLQVLDGALSGKQYLAGNKYSLADVHVHSVMWWISMLHPITETTPNVQAWMARVNEKA
ncbi:hypothetical protein MMC16_007824 [Acarospora aff. strigata]|nr:hypothetical protein [Acarospora aff. strigata]